MAISSSERPLSREAIERESIDLLSSNSVVSVIISDLIREIREKSFEVFKKVQRKTATKCLFRKNRTFLCISFHKFR